MRETSGLNMKQYNPQTTTHSTNYQFPINICLSKPQWSDNGLLGTNEFSQMFLLTADKQIHVFPL